MDLGHEAMIASFEVIKIRCPHNSQIAQQVLDKYSKHCALVCPAFDAIKHNEEKLVHIFTTHHLWLKCPKCALTLP